MAVAPKKQDGENERPAQHICPRSFVFLIIALNEVVTAQVQMNFPPDRYLIFCKELNFLRFLSCFQLLLEVR